MTASDLRRCRVDGEGLRAARMFLADASNAVDEARDGGEGPDGLEALAQRIDDAIRELDRVMGSQEPPENDEAWSGGFVDNH